MQCRDPDSIPGSGRSPEEGIGYPLQYSGLENSIDCIVHGASESWTQLKEFHFSLHFEIGKFKILSFILYSFKDFCIILCHFQFHMKFKICLIIFYKEVTWESDTNYIELVDQLGSIAIFTMLYLLFHKYELFLFIYIISIYFNKIIWPSEYVFTFFCYIYAQIFYSFDDMAS